MSGCLALAVVRLSLLLDSADTADWMGDPDPADKLHSSEVRLASRCSSNKRLQPPYDDGFLPQKSPATATLFPILDCFSKRPAVG